MMLRTTTAALAIAFVSGAAQAADETKPSRLSFGNTGAASDFWAGGYVGAQLGYSYSEFDIDTGASPGDLDSDQVIGGLTFGYLWNTGRGFYIGPEFQYDFADISVTDATSGDTASFDEIARLKLVVGREVGNGMLYGSAGVTYASFDGLGTAFDGFDGDDTSWVIGVGYDHRVTDTLTIGAEYQYHSFQGIGSSGSDVDLNTLHIKGTFRF